MGSFTAGAGTSYLLSSTAPVPSGTANGVLYLNGSKVVTSGSALNFNGTRLQILEDNPLLLLSDTDLTIRRAAIQFDTGGGTWSIENNNNLVLKNAAPGVAITTGSFIDLGRNVDPLIFGTSGLERMRLDASGNLLIGTTSASDNTATYKQVISIPQGAVSGGGLMVSSNQSANGGKALISAVNFATLTGAFTKPSIFSYSRATVAYASDFQVAGANSVNVLEIAANNLSLINSQKYIQHTDRNSTTGRYLNSDAYLYVQRNSGTVNVNEYVAYSSSYQTAVGNETIGTFVDFNAAPQRASPSPGSLVTTRYGVLIDFAATNVTNPWGVYQSNASVRNYFAGGAIFSGAALATNATNGFVYVPTCAGTPTGTPTTYTGTAPIVVDTTNNKLYFYSGGAWRDAGP